MSKPILLVMLCVGFGVLTPILSQSEEPSGDKSVAPAQELISKDLPSWTLFMKFDLDGPEAAKVGWREVSVNNSGSITVVRKKGREDSITIEESKSSNLSPKEIKVIFEGARTFLNSFRVFNDNTPEWGDGCRVTMTLTCGRRRLTVSVKNMRRHTDAGPGIASIFDVVDAIVAPPRGS